jgi:hypothetical protein
MKISFAPCITLSILCLALPVGLQADIQGGKTLKQSQGLAKHSSRPRESGLLVVPPIRAEVIRGKAVDIPIFVSPCSDNLRAKVLSLPQHGRLVQIEKRTGSVAVFRYLHDSTSQDSEDGFTILIADSLSDYGSKQTARILISNPQPILKVFPEGLIDFGKIPMDSSATNEVSISNTFGATVSGTLKVGDPWRILDDPNLNLLEGTSATIRLVFAPKADGAQSTQLTLDGTANFPEIFLRGEGIAPFSLLSPSQLELTKDSPDSAYTVTNLTAQPLEIGLTGLPNGIESPCLLSVPPHGTGELALSAAHLEITPDHYEKHNLLLSCGSYHRQVEVIVKGPKAPPSMELLNARDGHGTRLGVPLVLEGVVRNSSEEERDVNVVLSNLGKAAGSSTATLTLPAKGAKNFQLRWSPSQVGQSTLSIELLEHGVVVDRQSWPVSVKPELLPVSPAMQETKDRLAGPSITAESPEESRKFLYGLQTEIEKGFFMNRIILTWNYYGSPNTHFLIQQPSHHNSLTDRNKQAEADTSQPELQTLKGVSIVRNGYNYRARLPFIMPGLNGMKIFAVIPEGVKTDLPPKVIYFPLDWTFVFWPPIRIILILILILLVVRELRRRI